MRKTTCDLCGKPLLDKDACELNLQTLSGAKKQYHVCQPCANRLALLALSNRKQEE